MTVTQIYNLLNSITSEITGKTDLVAEDLSNVVDIGKELFGASDVDNYVKTLVNHIGKVIFVDRVYSGSAPSVLMDNWEFGSVLEKISADIPPASENTSWELTDGTSYDPNVFRKPVVSAKFFNSRVTFEVDMSFTEKQVKESFSSAMQLNSFISMLYTSVENSMTVKLDALVMRTINNMTAETLFSEYPAPATTGTEYKDSSGVRAVNLLYLYNTETGLSGDSTLTAAKAMSTPEFIRFASMKMALYIDRMKKLSTLFNVGGKERFTPSDMLHVILLSDFVASAGAYLQSDTFHEKYTALPEADTVPYWQGSGENYAFSSISAINVKTSGNHTVNTSGIIGVMFDRWALGVSNLDRRVTSNYNPKGEFYTNFYKGEAGYFNDLNENFVVFFIA